MEEIMKIRTAFISNSSSGSFILYKKDFTNEEIEIILNYLKNINQDHWDWEGTESIIRGYTSMNNEFFEEYLSKEFGRKSWMVKFERDY